MFVIFFCFTYYGMLSFVLIFLRRKVFYFNWKGKKRFFFLSRREKKYGVFFFFYFFCFCFWIFYYCESGGFCGCWACWVCVVWATVWSLTWLGPGLPLVVTIGFPWMGLGCRSCAPLAATTWIVCFNDRSFFYDYPRFRLWEKILFLFRQKIFLSVVYSLEIEREKIL